MNTYHEAPAINLESPTSVLAQAMQLTPANQGYFEQPLVQCFGSPEQSIYVDYGKVEINGIEYLTVQKPQGCIYSMKRCSIFRLNNAGSY